MRVLFLIPHPLEGASGRYRVLQYLPWLDRAGMTSVVRPFMSPALYRLLYQPGHVVTKFGMAAEALFRRVADIVRSSRVDVAVVHREALPLGTALLERLVAHLCSRMIFDFDDAIYLNRPSHVNSWTRLLRSGRKTASIVALSSHVIVGNRTLEAYVKQFHSRVSVIPTPIDTHWYTCRTAPTNSKRLVIGWIGSHSTAVYLELLQDVLDTILRRYPHVEVRVVGAGRPPLRLPRLRSVPWDLEREVEELHGFDIGLMPMPDDEWARGKCGFKALLYMSAGIPVVASPVGVNSEIVRDGVNGFLAMDRTVWLRRLSELIEDHTRRAQMGQVGRTIVEAEYSLEVSAPKFLRILTQSGVEAVQDAWLDRRASAGNRRVGEASDRAPVESTLPAHSGNRA